MMPGYGQMYPQMGYPMPGGMMQAPAVAPEAPAASAPPVVLPNPEDTGAKESDAAKGSSGATKDTAKPTGAADAIIKQYMGRR
jgi:hypothetical protein